MAKALREHVYGGVVGQERERERETEKREADPLGKQKISRSGGSPPHFPGILWPTTDDVIRFLLRALFVWDPLLKTQLLFATSSCTIGVEAWVVHLWSLAAALFRRRKVTGKMTRFLPLCCPCLLTADPTHVRSNHEEGNVTGTATG